MALDTSLNGIRQRYLTSLHGRRLALGPGHSSEKEPDFLMGPKGFCEPISGMTSGGTTITSTSVASPLPAYGVSVLGASGASGTTAYFLGAPIPGVKKTLYNLTTGYAVVGSTDGGANFMTTFGSAGSTATTLTFAGKGDAVELLGLTTAIWAVLNVYGGISSVSTHVTIA